jgi:hypothetical protein
MKHLFGFMGGFFLRTICNRRSIYVIIIQNANDVKEDFRATMFASLGLVTVMRIPILAFGGFFVYGPTLQFFMCCLFILIF